MAELAGRIAALDREVAQRDQQLVQRDQQLVQRAEHIEVLKQTNQDLRDEVARRAGWRWWLALPLLRIRRMSSRTADASHQDGP